MKPLLSGRTPPVLGAEPPQLAEADFERISRLAYDKFGLTLGKGKEELVKARLSKKMRELGIPSFRAYFDKVVADVSGNLLVEMIDALATNHTSFLREPAHFNFLRDQLLPAWRQDSPPGAETWIWSAACSSGEEPYTIAMWLADHGGPDAMQRYRILATDISTKILAVAQRAVYPAERLDPAPPGWRTKYFDDGGNGLLQLKPAVRRMVQFQRLNLVETFHAPRQFPLIFCRNVMIYFDPPTQERLVTGLARYIRPGGYLFVGHSESLGGLKQPLKYERPAIYRKA